ncbi:aspartate aminotransferase family protein [Bdellovibrio sp. NC01]|uniref:class-III pyridoxal-phosphate-dependent aminotransferase n=1 Tax=Bdellovibrio sp. NC01 TaxID=2220073 RepID=UPI00115A5985|nr:aspartate aminotransferase family protein [Bdellovibrio sp. NC01]QDK39310.1 aspartate aminotransferase family protein [Bdellovibrio sp. NC01]
MNLQHQEDKYLGRESSKVDFEVVRSKGSFVMTADGRRLIDFNMGWCVGNLGWSHYAIEDAMMRFKGPEYIATHQLYKGWGELAQILVKMAPGNMGKCFRATGGTEAVEIALQAAVAHTERTEFVSVENAYHGDSMAARAVGSPPFEDWNPLFRCHRVHPPLDGQALDQVEKFLRTKRVAAFIMEPIVCNLCVEIPSEEFMSGLQQMCKKYGTLLIIDEVATGFGRTGKMFASEHYKLKPDIICLAKAITSGVAPMGACVMTSTVAKSYQGEDISFPTYGWHPRSVTAALATIRYFQFHQENLFRHVEKVSEYIERRLNAMQFKHHADIRVKGMAIGVKFESKFYGAQICKRALERGLILSEADDGFTMFPALTVGRKTAAEAMDILESCLGNLH